MMEAAGVAADLHEQHEQHGPPAPHFSSAVDPQTLGMYLFIISEIMLFGAFFTAYFFIRVVNHATWPAPGHEIPILVAGVNTAILVSSSFTMHWALEGIKNNNHRAMKAGLLTTFLRPHVIGLPRPRTHQRQPLSRDVRASAAALPATLASALPIRRRHHTRSGSGSRYHHSPRSSPFDPSTPSSRKHPR